MATEVDVQYEASDESSENELLDKSLSVWKGWNVKETFDPIPLDLHTASSIGHYDCVRSFIARKVDLNRKNRGGWTPLMYACYIGHDNIVNLLLDAGVMVNIKNHKGQSPLMLAASCGNESVGYFICQQGAELEARDNKGWTALFHATYAGHQNMVRFLLEQGANINAVEPSMGMTPFMEAAAEGHEIIVQLFLQHGVKVNSKAHNGDTARSLALIYSHMKIVSLIDNHVMPITCLRSEAGLDADLSSSDESFPVRRPAQPRGGRGKKPGPSIRDGPDAIARLINRTPSNDNTQGKNQTNSCVPKGYVSFKHTDGEEAVDAPRLSYRDVTSPINLQDYNTLESSGGKESCDNDIDEDGNAFSKTGALTIKSSSGSSGGLMAALGINRDSSSIDSDDCQPQDSFTSHSDRASSLGGSCNSLNDGGLSPASSFNKDKDSTGDGKRESVPNEKSGSQPNSETDKQEVSKKLEKKAKRTNKERQDSTKVSSDISGKYQDTSTAVQQTHLISACGIDAPQEITANHPVMSPLPDVVNQQKTCNTKSKTTAHVGFVIGQEYGPQNSEYNNTSKRRPHPHGNPDHQQVQQGHRNKTDIPQGHNRVANSTPTHGPGNVMPQGQGHLVSHMQQGHMPQNMPNQGHMPQNTSGHGHMSDQSHMAPSSQQGHMSSNMQQGHMPAHIQGQGHIPQNLQNQGHMPANLQQGQGHMPTSIQQSHIQQGQSHMQGHLIPNSSDNGYHQQVFQNIGTNVSAHAQLGYQLFPSSTGMSGNPVMANNPMGPINVNPMLQEQGFFNQAKTIQEDEEVEPKDLAGLLDQLGLMKYLAVFEEQDVDLQVFLSLTDSDLKEVGIKLFGPRKKMTNAITRWHNHGPPSRSRIEQAYADRLDKDIQDLTIQLHKSYEQIEALKAQVLQEQRIRNVTESCLADIQRISFDTRSKCEETKEALRKLKQYHTEIKVKMQPMAVNELSGAMREELQLDERSRGTANEGRGDSADMIIKKIELYIKDLQKYLSVITMNADRLLTWGANNSHPS